MTINKSKLFAFYIIGSIGLFFLGFFVDKLIQLRRSEPLVEQKPYEKVFEIKGFELIKNYNSEDKFVDAEIKIKIEFISPLEELPEKYKKREIPLYVKGIPKLDKLESMREAFNNNKYLKIVREVNADYEEIKFKDRKTARIIRGIYLNPENYNFVKY